MPECPRDALDSRYRVFEDSPNQHKMVAESRVVNRTENAHQLGDRKTLRSPADETRSIRARLVGGLQVALLKSKRRKLITEIVLIGTDVYQSIIGTESDVVTVT